AIDAEFPAYRVRHRVSERCRGLCDRSRRLAPLLHLHRYDAAVTSETDLIQLIAAHAGAARDDVVVDIGDDAAVTRVPAGHELVLCADTMVAGVHFPDDTDAGSVGHKALAVNLSDLASMGAEPAWALVALTLPAPDD